jgi:hypothetical protein
MLHVNKVQPIYVKMICIAAIRVTCICRLRRINDSVFSSLKKEGIRLLFLLINIQISAYDNTLLKLHMYICVYIYIYIYIYICVCACVCVCIYIYICSIYVHSMDT